MSEEKKPRTLIQDGKSKTNGPISYFFKIFIKYMYFYKRIFAQPEVLTDKKLISSPDKTITKDSALITLHNKIRIIMSKPNER